MSVTIVGVRHHSPACARVVAHVIDTVRPRMVLVEGPSSMNGRLHELGLGHRPPIALYSFANRDDGHSASFYPFAAYSPEWVALERARALRLGAAFIDLPPGHTAFGERENRYSDEDLRRSVRFTELVDRLGFENGDAMWDHLFEQPSDPAALQGRLAAYFEALRADEPASAGDGARERFMAQCIAAVQAEAPDAALVVVCGGYHAPELRRLLDVVPDTPPDPAAFEPDGDAARSPVRREGIYLVPFSFRRLDAFRGYASGMPSPAYYQAVWDEGPERAAGVMFERAITTLRARKRRVSPADVIAASTMIESLRRLRDHQCPLRIDVLDGMACALLEEALDVPLPWSLRGPLSPRTHPLLALVVDAFTGEHRGRLADGTPRPPLVEDARAELAAVGITATGDYEATLADDAGRRRAAVLHRLRILAIPGVTRLEARRFGRHDARLAERWRVAIGTAFDPALIEAAMWGATLLDAARGALETRADAAAGAIALAEVLHEAALAGLGALSQRTLWRLRDGLRVEGDLEVLGRALARLVLLGQDAHHGLDAAVLDEVLRVAFDRGQWLLEGVVGADAAPVRGHVDAVVALRDTVTWLGARLGLDTAALGRLALRRAADVEAPPSIRGACLGLVASLTDALAQTGVATVDEDALVLAVRGAAIPERIGELLGGLFALAREPLRQGDALLTVIDRTLTGLSADGFMQALPSLRQAFAYFPPRERLAIAERIVAGAGVAADGRLDPRDLLAPLDAAVLAEGLARDRAAQLAMRRYGLDDT